jgi:hypothetical protein
MFGFCCAKAPKAKVITSARVRNVGLRFIGFGLLFIELLVNGY